jgi:chemotaxis protein MotB
MLMLRPRHLALVLAPIMVIGCKTQKDIDKAVAAAVDERNAACQAEMDKAQKAHAAEIGTRDNRIANLEKEVTRMGGDLSQVKSELGQKDTALASTKMQLEVTAKERDQLMKLREQAEKEAAQFKQMTEKLKSMVDAGQLQVITRKGRMTLKLPDDILFPSGSKKLKKEGEAALVQVAEVLKGVEDREFFIAGHTDNIPVKKGGAFRDNWELSTARAVEVVNLMIKNGVPPERLGAAGFGENDPIAPNDTPENRQQNRRLEIILMPKIEALAVGGAS